MNEFSFISRDNQPFTPLHQLACAATAQLYDSERKLGYTYKTHADETHTKEPEETGTILLHHTHTP